ncbi:MAG: DUF4339 domain-containing protein, partial [Arenimonas sp.]
MTEWFYARDGRQSGPVTFAQLLELAGNGGLAGNDLVWNASMENWTPAGRVAGIFDIHTPPEIPEAGPTNASNPYAAPQSNWNDSAASSVLALAEIVHGSTQIDPMECIRRGYEIFRREFANVLLVGLVYFACVIGMSFVFGMIEIMITMMISYDDQARNEPNILAIVVTVIS